jgi:hypothetical protein
MTFVTCYSIKTESSRSHLARVLPSRYSERSRKKKAAEVSAAFMEFTQI